MKTKRIWLICACISLFICNSYGDTIPRLGINISTITRWSSEYKYVNVMKQMRVSSNQAYDSNQLDTNGYPRYLKTDQVFRMGIGDGTNNGWPTGTYNIYYDGEGTFQVLNNNATNLIKATEGHYTVNVVNNGGSSWWGLQITQTTPGNYVRNLRIIMPGFENTYQANPYHPSFIEHWKDVECFRFMDWCSTNNQPRIEWSEFQSKDHVNYDYDATSGESGVRPVCPEAAIDLCNYMNKNIWFCMPHQASDDCIRKWAQLTKNKLKAGLKIYVEYSNECWNFTFEQASYCRSKGLELGVTSYYTYRSGQVWKIWEEVFGADTARVINVFAHQDVNHYLAAKGLDLLKDPACNPAGTKAEAFATAPYIQCTDFTCEGTCSLDDFFYQALTVFVPNTIESIKANVKIAKDRGIEYLTYEGGQHFSNSGNEVLAEFYTNVNRDMRMKTVYLAYLNGFKKETGGALFMHYNSCGMFGTAGSWGALEYYNQDTSAAPKYLALKQYLATKVLATGITISTAGNNTTINTDKGTLQCMADITPGNVSIKNVLWEVDNTAIATMSVNGLLTAVANGSVVVKATALDGSGVSTTKTITVSNQIVLISAISLRTATGSNVLNTNGTQLQIIADITPVDAVNKTLNWTLSNNSLATISPDGLLTPLKDGNLIITATATDGTNEWAMLTITILNQTQIQAIDQSDDNMVVYPNPAHDYIIFSIPENVTGSVIIYNSAGMIVLERTILSNTLKVDLSTYPKGIYLARIASDHYCMTRSFLIQ